jgi:hypothetical protein
VPLHKSGSWNVYLDTTPKTPQAVANSFVQMMQQNADFVITSGRLRTQSGNTKDSKIEYDQNKAFENADFIYTKTGAVTKITVKSLITILNGLLQQIK